MWLRALRLSLLTLALLSRAAQAGDGRVEISQAGALAGSVTAGDGPGFPVELYTPGSFVLTSNLTVPTDTGVIFSTVDGVTIDLNGFELVGPGSCTGLGSGVSCSGASAYGVVLGGRTVLYGGTVRGFGYGIYSLGVADIRGVVIESNAGGGILVPGGSVVSQAIVYRNGGDGIYATSGDGVRIESSTVSSNALQGIWLSDAGSVVGCAVYDNGFNGLVVQGPSVLRANSAYLNESNGILSGSGVVSDSTAYLNGKDGITPGLGAVVQRNSMRSNAEYGLGPYGSDASYRENTISANTLGTIRSPGLYGIDMGANSCNGAASCP